MTIKYSGDIRELCYPFIHETSYLCDFEMLTDEWCAQIGAAINAFEQLEDASTFSDLISLLQELQPLTFNLNGSIRGRCCISEAHIEAIKQQYDHYQQEVTGRVNGFVLPRGPRPVPELNICRSQGKKVIRILVRVDEEDIKVPESLPRFANLLVNLFFLLTVVVKKRMNIEEVAYISPNYGPADTTRKQ
ncbi:cobalamin adenosyltransferase [Endozoicomonadaceae bacterium StTr2]